MAFAVATPAKLVLPARAAARSTRSVRRTAVVAKASPVKAARVQQKVRFLPQGKSRTSFYLSAFVEILYQSRSTNLCARTAGSYRRRGVCGVLKQTWQDRLALGESTGIWAAVALARAVSFREVLGDPRILGLSSRGDKP